MANKVVQVGRHPAVELGRPTNDHLVLEASAGFVIRDVIRLLPRPVKALAAGDPQFPFVGPVTKTATEDAPNLFHAGTPNLRGSAGDGLFNGILYMLDWDQPGTDEPGPHFKINP
jgi:hypothetical protein